MGSKERDREGGYPEIDNGVVTKQHGSKKGVMANEIRNGLCPDARPVISREDHDEASDYEALGRPVEDPEVQRVSVISLPGREEHGQAGDQRGEDPCSRGTQAHSRRLEEACEGAVEGVDAVVEQLAESAGSAGAACLLAVHIVHGRVHPEAERKAIVQPRRCLEGVRNVYNNPQEGGNIQVRPCLA